MINFLNLEYFLVAAEELNFTKAAKKLFISQQSLSNHISNMEKEFDVILFNRTTPLTLTYAGQALKEKAKQMLELRDETYRQLADIKDFSVGQLTLGLSHTRGRVILPEILPVFKDRFPNIDLKLVEGNSSELADDLLHGNIDLIIDMLPFKVENVETVPICEEEISAAFRPNTKALFGETISNPTLEVLDIEKFARIAHSHGVPLIVDNTFPTPINCRPFEWGADIVVHSTTKYMDGHATSVGGAIVDSGNFDWDAHADKFPGLCTPDESYHGLTYTKAFGKMAYITKATAQLMRDLGSIQSPQNAFLLNLGLETLHLRMPQHCKNAQAVAEYLAQNDKVAWVNYCGLPGDKYYEQAQKYMPNGSCGVVTFGLKGGREESIKFMDSLKLAAIVTHVADARTCVLHPASHTHRQLTDEQLMEAGVRPDLIRFSVGIENAEDIIADIEQALNA